VTGPRGRRSVSGLLSGILVLGALAALGRAGAQNRDFAEYDPLEAAPEHHRPLLENEFVLVLDVSIPAGATVPAHLHPWPAVFITLKPGHLVFRNLAGEVVREARPPLDRSETPQVEWRKPDTEPMVISNVGTSEQRALRIELKLLGR
jgi:hypothetical protein